MRKIFLSLLLLISSFVVSAQQEDYYQKHHLRYENYTYLNTLKTVLLHLEGNPISKPIIRLGSNDQLKLSFDDLDLIVKDFNYTFVHCNVDWQPSELIVSEYIEGVQEDFITDYKYSSNALQQYVHYNLIFPTVDMKPVRSGNYIIMVYEDGDRENLILTKRFMVLEDKVKIKARINRATVDRSYKQEVDFSIFYNENYELTNPYHDLRVVVQQNGRWDNAVTTLQPLFVKNNELEYDYDDENVFPGGNEYRYFDTKSLRVKSENVVDIVFQDSVRHIYLLPDKKRSFLVYNFWGDINGKYVVRASLAFDNETDADYTPVHFKLPYHENIPKGNLYIFGQLCDWQFKKECKMHYNHEKLRYENTLLLKQGYYNYEYVFLKDGKTIGDNTLIEGSHWETENDYTIYVYHRSLGDNYDRLVGMGTFSSSAKIIDR